MPVSLFWDGFEFQTKRVGSLKLITNLLSFKCQLITRTMKSKEFIREAQRKSLVFLRQGKGSHEIYEKDGKQAVIPNHGSKELGKGLEMKLRKEMGL